MKCGAGSLETDKLGGDDGFEGTGGVKGGTTEKLVRVSGFEKKL